MLFTSYFAKLKDLPADVIPVAICGKSPEWYKGAEYKKLAPTWSIFKEYKDGGDAELYTQRFKKEVLSKLDKSEVIKDLLLTVHNFKGLNYAPDICLVCYERPADFCHRHLVAEWLGAEEWGVFNEDGKALENL